MTLVTLLTSPPRGTLDTMRTRLAGLTIAIAVTAFPSWAQDTASTTERAIVQKVQPAFPELALRNRLTGVVKLRVVIARDGKPKTVEVLGGNPVFVDAAAQSIKQWRWAATDRDTTQVVEIRFQPS